MEVKGSSQSCQQVNVRALAVPVFKGEKADEGFLKALDQAVGGLVSAVIEAEEFAAKEAETCLFHLTGEASMKARRLLLVGCGDVAESFCGIDIDE